MPGTFQPFLLKVSVHTEKKPIFKIFSKLLHDASRKCKDQGRGEELAAEHNNPGRRHAEAARTQRAPGEDSSSCPSRQAGLQRGGGI